MQELSDTKRSKEFEWLSLRLVVDIKIAALWWIIARFCFVCVILASRTGEYFLGTRSLTVLRVPNKWIPYIIRPKVFIPSIDYYPIWLLCFGHVKALSVIFYVFFFIHCVFKLFSGVFDQISLVFLLRRDIRYYIMEYYFPVICVVFLSFMSFWIHYKATPARVALPVTTFLTLTTMLEHVRSSASIIGTADALEIFLSGSNIFVFANIIEYALVGITERYWTKVGLNYLVKIVF